LSAALSTTHLDGLSGCGCTIAVISLVNSRIVNKGIARIVIKVAFVAVLACAMIRQSPHSCRVTRNA
jgi:hypothetical protein